MHKQPYVGRIALCTRKKLLKSGEIRHFYGTIVNVEKKRLKHVGSEQKVSCLAIHYSINARKLLWSCLG